MKTILFITLFVLSFSSFADDESCVNFFKGSMHSGQVSVPSEYPCRSYTATGFPKNFPYLLGEVEVSLYHFLKGWTENTADVTSLTMITEAVNDSMVYFKDAMEFVKKVKILYTNDFPNGATAADANTSNGVCYIRVFYVIGSDDQKFLRSSIAHELHHCYLIYKMFNTAKDSEVFHNWIIEGMADHFSNKVYPKDNIEWMRTKDYNAKAPLTAQANPYSASAFFQHWSNKGIDLFLADQVLNSLGMIKNIKEFHQKLSQVPDITETYRTFAELAFTRTITDSGGGYVPMPEPKADLIADLKQNQNLFEVVTKPFSTFTMKFKAPPQGKYTFKIDPAYYAHGYRLSVKTQNQKNFKSSTPGAPVSITVDCDESFRNLVVLLTNTDAEADTTRPIVTVDYEEVGPEVECPCKRTNKPIDACLKGKWVGDNEVYAKNLYWQVNRGPRVDMDDIVASGGYFMDFIDEDSGKVWADKQFVTAKLYAGGFEQEYEHITDYTFDVVFSQQNEGRFCVEPRNFKGRTRITIDGQQSEMDLGALINSIPGADEITEVTYRCTPTTLTLYYKSRVYENSSEEWIYHRKK